MRKGHYELNQVEVQYLKTSSFYIWSLRGNQI